MLTFQELYESNVEDVYRFSLWLSGDRFEAEDITLAVLLPRSPSPDGLDYLKSAGATAVWPAGDGFAQSPTGPDHHSL